MLHFLSCFIKLCFQPLFWHLFISSEFLCHLYNCYFKITLCTIELLFSENITMRMLIFRDVLSWSFILFFVVGPVSGVWPLAYFLVWVFLPPLLVGTYIGLLYWFAVILTCQVMDTSWMVLSVLGPLMCLCTNGVSSRDFHFLLHPGFQMPGPPLYRLAHLQPLGL